MQRRTIRNLLTSACAAAFVLAPTAAALADDCPPPPSQACQDNPSPLGCPLSPYAAAVLNDNIHSPSAYWRLGEDRDFASDWYLGVGSTAALGSQVQRRVPGALACDTDRAVRLSGAVPDGIWESHIVGDPEATRAAAAGRQPYALAIWVKPHILDGNSRRIGGHEMPEGGWFVAARDRQLTFSRYQRLPLGTAWSTITVSSGLPLDSWSFVVAAYGADHVMRLYLDGREVGHVESHLQLPPEPEPLDPNAIYPDRGRLVLGASGRSWSQSHLASKMYLEWDGDLDEAAIYQDTRIPTPELVQRLWTIGTTGQDPAA